MPTFENLEQFERPPAGEGGKEKPPGSPPAKERPRMVHIAPSTSGSYDYSPRRRNPATGQNPKPPVGGAQLSYAHERSEPVSAAQRLRALNYHGSRLLGSTRFFWKRVKAVVSRVFGEKKKAMPPRARPEAMEEDFYHKKKHRRHKPGRDWQSGPPDQSRQDRRYEQRRDQRYEPRQEQRYEPRRDQRRDERPQRQDQRPPERGPARPHDSRPPDSSQPRRENYQPEDRNFSRHRRKPRPPSQPGGQP